MKTISLQEILLSFIFLVSIGTFAQSKSDRELILIDKDWRFSLGHLYDTQKDFGHAEGYFSYLAKTGFGDGPAAIGFDDRAWRKINLPHDWAVEQPFSEKASYSHGFKAGGKGFPEKSIGWYRKKINIPQSDQGKIISLKFDGVFRNSKVFFNGYFLGTEESGYNGFEYDVTAYVNYGGENTIVVRADASMEEGWFYEGAGIYRHVYIQKTNPLHLIQNGTYVTSEIQNDDAEVTAETTIENKGNYKGSIEILQTILDASGKEIATISGNTLAPEFYKTIKYISKLKVKNPLLWDIDSPNLYRLLTQIKQEGKNVDSYETNFGIRTIFFDPEKGFFLNGKSLKLKGTNNHQDHAGIGAALPDELQYYRIKKLKDMGSNAYRCSHNPPTSELLDACDKLGMLVIDETRLMGINYYHLNDLKRMIERDRNHPSIICWSVGNEEWNIEGNVIGERITNVMQGFSKSIDSTRPVTVGISSGFKSGISSVVEIMGYNYMGNGDIDAHRNEFKNQPGMGTEEGSTFTTRGIYFTDDAKHYKSAYDVKPRPTFYSIEEGWKFYATRPYLAGMFIWTGFDYRGEPTPYGWPSVTSYFGMMDVCGFPKDNVFYLKSWWGNTPVLHIMPHWNWSGMEGKVIDVWVHSNCDEVELFLNKKSLGKKKMDLYGHLEWKVKYIPGTLEAIGYKNGKKVLAETQKTTEKSESIKLSIDKENVANANVSVITVEVLDKNGLHVPTANDEITFSIKNGKILGVGNGDPTSLENDQFIDEITLASITNLQEQKLSATELPQELPTYLEKDWNTAFKDRDYKNQAKSYVYRGEFDLKENSKNNIVNFFYKKIGVETLVFINGNRVNSSIEDVQKYILSSAILKEGKNTIYIITKPLQKIKDWDVMNTDLGIIQIVKPSEPWKRKLFNGYAQIIIQKEEKGKDVILSVSAKGLKAGVLNLSNKQ
ncbi:beta-galactosidase GalA [Flavobacterium hibernum]|uniref:Beta-galactosidase n=1 Tax=Flavobacterium hibernum TaxID=37752 RepID=A0A0D0EXR2_9FLAO|nr:beta-galactosidase GalA [Flavobacterium hibernum]KIO52006.1 beta-galactosidase [Flavobacterium hibernum]OXA89033.1 beta-galactosidase [Flavobacterium hibernum]STO09826.1 Beta-galactosidase [Flavobacterium hibernum]